MRRRRPSFGASVLQASGLLVGRLGRARSVLLGDEVGGVGAQDHHVPQTGMTFKASVFGL